MNGDPSPTGCGIRRLQRGYRDASKGGTRPREQVAEVAAEGLCSDRNCKGNEHEQHGVFCSGGTALITQKATGQTVHFNFLLQGVTPSQCAPKAITVATQPVVRLTQSLSMACQAVVRKAPFVI